MDGLESIVDAWAAGLWPALLREANPAAGTAAAADGSKAEAAGPAAPLPPPPRCRVRLVWGTAADLQEPVPPEAPLPEGGAEAEGGGGYSAERPYPAPVAAARWLTTPASGDRKVLHLELDLAGSGIRYSPGDSLGLLPQARPLPLEGGNALCSCARRRAAASTLPPLAAASRQPTAARRSCRTTQSLWRACCGGWGPTATP